LAAGAIFSFVFSADLHFQSVLLTILSAVIPTLLFIFYFVRFEIVTTFVGFLVYILLSRAVIFIPTDDPVFFQQGIGILLMLAGLIMYGFIALFSKSKEPSTAVPFVPEYIRKVEERERLMRELEIARNIQQEFLPKVTPNIENYQVAAFCQPAWEVGGDYFDFVPLGNRQLGIVIGDVSNKGVSAAFYMTLVKGFLRALAIHRKKPAEILSETNTLFYDNVERGHFISMIFGTLDSAKNEFIFARAGHNPVLLMIGRSNEVKWFTPKGVGIGILENQRFQAVIREEKILLQSGDILILYTDGYPEAMNESLQEFGENQLQQIIDKYRSLEPEQIILHLENAIKIWEGKKPSIDDRTIIVIKRIR
jgi:serine phosphatase RsbU (regulator of sigma subunit)